VGKYFYSLDDICRGILRAKKCLFLDCDPRIHFALSYGTTATPPARLFTHESLDRELEVPPSGVRAVRAVRAVRVKG
jgi:hypothetical protein